MKQARHNALALVAVLTLGLAGVQVWAQEAPPPPPTQGPERPMGPHGRGMMRRGPDRPMMQLFLRVAPLVPAEQEQVLAADEFFQQLPPRAQENFRRRLAEFNALPEAERRLRLQHWNVKPPIRQAEELFQRVAPLPLEEQQRILNEDELFQSLPPQAQERFRRRLDHFNSLPAYERERRLEKLREFSQLAPEQQQRLRQRARMLENMSPEQRLQAQRLFQAWRELSPERRQLLEERVHHLQQASPEQRRILADDPQFLSPLSENERQLLRGVWKMREQMPPPPGGPRGPRGPQRRP
ncbi:MAG TPA: DUF3106 domain-containing protein [Candidatus Xenobia bacterium]|nr:DUF3106 domain-containing protein [Candidatus Xenobia bacterium]